MSSSSTTVMGVSSSERDPSAPLRADAAGRPRIVRALVATTSGPAGWRTALVTCVRGCCHPRAIRHQATSGQQLFQCATHRQIAFHGGCLPAAQQCRIDHRRRRAPAARRLEVVQRTGGTDTARLCFSCHRVRTGRHDQRAPASKRWPSGHGRWTAPWNNDATHARKRWQAERSD
jgi:hypothetical protein